MAYDNLFQPLQIGSCTVPNRIARTAHSTGTTGEDLIAYHEERARGGVGLTVIEIAGVQPSSATAIAVYSDAVLPFYDELTRRMHVHGTKVFQQLWHGGAAYARAGQPVSASAVPAPSVNLVPRPMTHAMIDETVAAFATAAARCRDGGLDGIELHGAHGYLIGQFLSPATNLRDDELRRHAGEPHAIPGRDPRSDPQRGRPGVPGGRTAVRHRLHRRRHRSSRSGRDRSAHRAPRRLPRHLDGFVLALPQVPLHARRPARLRDREQRTGHPRSRRAHHRDRADHDPRPRQPPRRNRRGRHGVARAGDGRRPLPGGQGSRRTRSTRSDRASARAWDVSHN